MSVERSTVSVVWGMTNYGPIYSPVYDSHMRVMARTSRELTVRHLGKIGGVGATDRMYVHSASNRMVHDFLGLEDATHLFWTESDMLLPDETILRLLDVDQPIVSGVYFLRNGEGQPCLYRKVVRMKSNPFPFSPVSLFPQEEPFQLDGCPGMGCVLIKREVFEKLDFPWFDLKEGMYGQDIFFYTRVYDAGISVWVHPKVRCGQIDHCVVSWEDYAERLERDPSFAGSGYIIGTTTPQCGVRDVAG